MSVYRLLYSLLWYVLCPFILLRLFWRSRTDKAYRTNWRQRLGFITLENKPRIWLHAVSVGETIAAKPLVEAILTRYPNHQLLITNTTPTGLATTERLYGDRVEHCYFPYDAPNMVSRFVKRTNASILIIMETELWPNLLYHCHKQNIPTIIANARLSKRSTKGYRRLEKLIKPALECISYIACRSEQDIQHFLEIGAKPETVGLAGNIKFDISNTQSLSPLQPLKKQLASDALIWVAASTHKGEDEIILSCFEALRVTYPTLVLVIAPRHPERFNDVYQLCSATTFDVMRRSESAEFAAHTDIILGDSLGEMAYWYAAADVVFLGGTLVNTGGHNPLEATVFGAPVVTGPAVFNFEDVFGVLTQAELAWVEQTAEALTEQLKRLLTLDEQQKQTLSKHAAQVLEDNKGATQLLLKQVERLMP
ncbi:3-deoxy-D-manno-octulosonic acid transferase [Leucothrix sargassi]|nr:3-deoxy-D-manno-octulosonic acid transferase [Leucothrix sargassi]